MEGRYAVESYGWFASNKTKRGREEEPNIMTSKLYEAVQPR
jgi:hypothetical protein